MKVSGGTLTPANCSVPGGKRRSPGSDFALILEVNKVSRQLGYQILSRESPACLIHTHTHPHTHTHTHLPGQLTSLPYQVYIPVG